MRPGKFILVASLPLAAMISIVSLVGLLTPDFYSAETRNWQVQSRGQDTVDLFLIAPTLLVTSLLVYRKNKLAFGLWGGVVLYLTYTFFLYCFDVHFNKLFILYCFCLGLSFYSLLYFLYHASLPNSVADIKNKSILRTIGLYFIILASLFYLLWMGEIIPAIWQSTTPASITETGLVTNGVHVLDLAIVLPAIFTTGVLLIQHKAIAFKLTPAFLAFFILMDITIGYLNFLMNQEGVDSGISLTVLMGALGLLSTIILIVFYKNIKPSIYEDHT
jgi:hypothetical protein